MMDTNKFTFTGISDMALGKDLRAEASGHKASGGLIVLNSVSFFLAGVSLLFLLAFRMNQSVSLTWFFLSEFIAFILIPILARQGLVKASKVLLIAYANVGILILSAVFGDEAMIQAFFIPAMGLSILLFDQKQVHLRNFGIFLSVLSFFILDYLIFERVYISDIGYTLVRWSVLTGAFVTTWLIFNTFSQFKEEAESKTNELLEKEKRLNAELNKRQQKLEKYIDQLEMTTEKLAKSTRAKSDFLATMSHEIRTPMNAILGMTYLLKQDEPRNDQIEPLNILEFSGKNLLSLIDDVLDFSKIEAGKIDFEQVKFEIHSILRSIIESFQVTAADKDLDLELHISEEVPDVLIGDSARLTQIINNLLSNAVKFTEEGKVRLSVKTVKEDHERVRLLFEVMDTGIGFGRDRAQTIFSSFTQGSQDTMRLFGGTGLGLTICKQLTELQGGTLTADSEPGEGSTFSLQLDFGMVSVESEESIGDLNDAVPHSLKGLRVILAEDNIVNQKVMLRFLERWDIDMTLAHDGEEVVNAMQENMYDVILMDLQMPKMNGYEATKMIRKMEDPYKRNIPIIALTAAALEEVREKVFACGMNDFITKPFNPSDLESKLQGYLKT